MLAALDRVLALRRSDPHAPDVLAYVLHVSRDGKVELRGERDLPLSTSAP